MINQQIALVRREIWEHRSIWVTPVAIASVITLLAVDDGRGYRCIRRSDDMPILAAEDRGHDRAGKHSSSSTGGIVNRQHHAVCRRDVDSDRLLLSGRAVRGA